MFKKTIEEKFWIKVQKQRGPKACWIWTGFINQNGNGVLTIDGRQIGAHRISWQLTHGDFPEEHVVSHTCATPSCIRPNHLILQTRAENTQKKNEQKKMANFLAKVDEQKETGCWQIKRISKSRKSPREHTFHKVSFKLFHGEIPNGSVIYHLCKNPLCVNPAHLQAGKRSEVPRNSKTFSMNEDFWSNVQKSPNSDDCWFWRGKENSGYVCVCINSKKIKAHRLLFEQSYGPIPKRKIVLHTCGVKACLNPSHLKLGGFSDIERKKEPLEVVFWDKVRKLEGDNSCWLWTGNQKHDGYGRFIFNGIEKPAHRISFELHHGTINPNKSILHLCNNRLCVRPEHLQEGTAKENTQYMLLSDRGRWGGEKSKPWQNIPFIKRKPFEEEFWNKVDKTDGQKACWLWLGTQSADGYGLCYNRITRKQERAHRTALILCGVVLENKLVLHECDTPLCVNPRHLRAGTSKDNVRDMYDKGRENLGQKILTDDDARNIRIRIKKGENPMDVAGIFSVKLERIWEIATGRRYKSAGGPLSWNGDRPKGESTGSSKLSAKKVRAIRKLKANGMSIDKIAKQFKLDRSTIRSVISGRTWGHLKDE